MGSPPGAGRASRYSNAGQKTQLHQPQRHLPINLQAVQDSFLSPPQIRQCSGPHFSPMAGNVGSQSTKEHEGQKISTKRHEGPRRDTKKNQKKKDSENRCVLPGAVGAASNPPASGKPRPFYTDSANGPVPSDCTARTGAAPAGASVALRHAVERVGVGGGLVRGLCGWVGDGSSRPSVRLVPGASRGCLEPLRQTLLEVA